MPTRNWKPETCLNSWGRQIVSTKTSYESSQTTIWTDKVTNADRNPGVFAARDVKRFKRDVLGNRKRGDTPLQRARGIITRQVLHDEAFRKEWAAMSPAQCNALVEALAATM